MTELETEELLTLLRQANNEIDRLQAQSDEWEQTANDNQQEITRLTDHNKTLQELIVTKEEAFEEVVQQQLKVINERDELAETVAKLQKQLDQECDTNAELEDKLAELPVSGTIGLVDREGDKEILIKEVKLLKEKLALCDSYYKEQQKKFDQIMDIIMKPKLPNE